MSTPIVWKFNLPKTKEKFKFLGGSPHFGPLNKFQNKHKAPPVRLQNPIIIKFGISKFLHTQSSFKGCLQLKVVFHQHQNLSSIKGHLSSKIILIHRLSSIKGCLPSKFFFHQLFSSIRGYPPSKVIFNRRSSSI